MQHLKQMSICACDQLMVWFPVVCSSVCSVWWRMLSSSWTETDYNFLMKTLSSLNISRADCLVRFKFSSLISEITSTGHPDGIWEFWKTIPILFDANDDCDDGPELGVTSSGGASVCPFMADLQPGTLVASLHPVLPSLPFSWSCCRLLPHSRVWPLTVWVLKRLKIKQTNSKQNCTDLRTFFSIN